MEMETNIYPEQPVAHIISDHCVMVVCGRMATVHVDNVASTTAKQYSVLGTMPSGILPDTTLLEGTELQSFGGALGFRGASSSGEEGFLSIEADGRIRIWTSTNAPYYFGCAAFPVRTDEPGGGVILPGTGGGLPEPYA